MIKRYINLRYFSLLYTMFTRAYRYCVDVSHTCKPMQYRYARVNIALL